MTDDPNIPADGGAPGGQPAQGQQAKTKQRLLTQYIRDLSFQNGLAQKGLTGDIQPEMQVQVNLDARKRGGDDQYEVITKLKLTSTSKSSGDTLFVLELEYAGVFKIEGVPEQQLHPYLLIECPRITFPFLRRLVSDINRDGGFPPVTLEIIDFLALYRNELQRRVQEQGGGTDQPPQTTEA